MGLRASSCLGGLARLSHEAKVENRYKLQLPSAELSRRNCSQQCSLLTCPEPKTCTSRLVRCRHATEREPLFKCRPSSLVVPTSQRTKMHVDWWQSSHRIYRQPRHESTWCSNYEFRHRPPMELPNSRNLNGRENRRSAGSFLHTASWFRLKACDANDQPLLHK